MFIPPPPPPPPPTYIPDCGGEEGGLTHVTDVDNSLDQKFRIKGKHPVSIKVQYKLGQSYDAVRNRKNYVLVLISVCWQLEAVQCT